jgi:hypothetical protein
MGELAAAHSALLAAAEAAAPTLLRACTPGDLLRLVQCHTAVPARRPSLAWWAALLAALPPPRMRTLPPYVVVGVLSAARAIRFRPAAPWLTAVQQVTLHRLATEFSAPKLAGLMKAMCGLHAPLHPDWCAEWFQATRPVLREWDAQEAYQVGRCSEIKLRPSQPASNATVLRNVLHRMSTFEGSV